MNLQLTSSAADLEVLIPDVVPWIHEAGNPYFDYFFGSPVRARRMLVEWMHRPTSEVSINRGTFLYDGEQVVGGFLAMDGAQLRRCRKADALAAFSQAEGKDREVLLARMAVVRTLFEPVPDDAFYLSKLGVVQERREAGLGRQLVQAYLEAGEAAGFQRFRLDVAEENPVATRLYEHFGFQVQERTSAAEAHMAYLAMALER